MLPELDVLHSHSDEFVEFVWIPLDNKDLILVSAGRCQLLAFLPVPYNDTVVVIQAYGGEAFPIRRKVTGTDSTLVFARQDGEGLQGLSVPYMDGGVTANLAWKGIA